MESDNAHFTTLGGWFSNTTKNHSELHKFFAKRRDIVRGRIKSIRQINLAINSENLFD